MIQIEVSVADSLYQTRSDLPSPSKSPACNTTHSAPTCSVVAARIASPSIRVTCVVPESALRQTRSDFASSSKSEDSNVATATANSAPTVCGPLIVTVQAPKPEHTPVQPTKTASTSVAAVSVTVEPPAKLASHATPQPMPEGTLSTRPVPDPVCVTESMRLLASTTNVAVTDCTLSMVTTHAPVPVHAPDQPANTDPALAAAFNRTVEFDANGPEHVPGQFIPAGNDVTVPAPVPSTARRVSRTHDRRAARGVVGEARFGVVVATLAAAHDRCRRPSLRRP